MSMRDILRRHAAALLHDMADELDRSPEAEPEQVQHATCRHCGKPICRGLAGSAYGPWVHGDSRPFSGPKTCTPAWPHLSAAERLKATKAAPCGPDAAAAEAVPS